MADLQLGSSLKSQVEQRGGTTLVALDGHFNEATDLVPLTKLRGPLTLDLSKVKRINSVGVRDWLDFVQTCETSGIELTFERCPPSIVSQMSMISNFMGHSRVKSVEVPYICTACRYEYLLLLELVPGVQLQQAIPCPKCRARMEIDDVVDIYAELVRRA